MKTVISVLLLGLLLTACANNSSSRAREINIRYGEVVRISRVPVPSAVPAGAIVGGFTGLVLARDRNPGRQVASGIAGAALGGLVTSALEGDRRAYQYHLRFVNGTETDYITENGFLQTGDCVAVERGDYANIRRVSNALCESGPRPREIQAKSTTEASQCHEAKDQLLLASTDEEIEQASRKVRILCQF